MKVIRKTLKLSKEEYYVKHLSLINALLPVHLTPKEIEVMANFMLLNGSIAEDRFGTTAKKIVMGKMDISLSGLGNYLKALKEKGFIIGNDILPILFPEGNKQEYMFRLIID